MKIRTLVALWVWSGLYKISTSRVTQEYPRVRQGISQNFSHGSVRHADPPPPTIPGRQRNKGTGKISGRSYTKSAGLGPVGAYFELIRRWIIQPGC